MYRMKSFLLVGLVMLMMLAACVPTPIPTEAEATQPGLAETLAAETESAPTTEVPAGATAAPTAASTNPEPAAVATSRGPNLEATDPATVQLASGEVQLVEFFRFT